LYLRPAVNSVNWSKSRERQRGTSRFKAQDCENFLARRDDVPNVTYTEQRGESQREWRTSEVLIRYD